MLLATALLLVCSSLVEAHIALFHPSMYGLYGDQPYREPWGDDFRNNGPIRPCRGHDRYTINQWFANGRKGYPPPAGVFMELPAGGAFVGELGCDRVNTSMGYPWAVANTDKKALYACRYPDGRQSPLHNSQKADDPLDLKYFGGTALAIAYTSDIAALKPSDMTVISINYTSPWFRETVYRIPAGLPPCPPGGCLCSWNWIHNNQFDEGYGAEIYNNVYACKVTGNTNSANVLVPGAARPAKRCDNPADCVHGPKQPMYLWQGEGNNVAMNPDHSNPLYKERYGWTDGAQTDLFIQPLPEPAALQAAKGRRSRLRGARDE